jgi:hypothetical protein
MLLKLTPGADIEATDNNGLTPLHMAARFHNTPKGQF